MIRVSAIIVAAGEGRRFGSAKQFALLRGKPVIDWSLRAFEAHEKINEIILVLPNRERERYFMERYQKIKAVVKGGEKRQDSVLNGFRRIEAQSSGLVLIHDGARPLVTKDLISRVIDGAKKRGAVIPVIPVEDTVKEAAAGEIIRTLDRDTIFRVQTPQGFSWTLLGRALQQAGADNYYGTDEAALVERLGEKVFTVAGETKNIKITTPLHLRMAEAFFED